jgi:hypothetical protein
MKYSSITGLALFVCAALLVRVAAASAEAALSIAVTGPGEQVFVWSTMRCEAWDVPDSAARAWRDGQNRVHLIASHLTNRAMVGADLDHLRPDCRIVYKGGEQDAPERYDDRSWISATYTTDGNQLFALIHNEFHGQLRPVLCPSRVYDRCWRNTVTLAASHDGGFSFTHATPPWQFVAGLPYRYQGDVGHRSGYFNPSNIIRRGDFYYAFFWAEADGAQRRGACLMRTGNLADRHAWRGWDGADFTVQFADPYIENLKDVDKHVCAPVAADSLTSFVSSVTLHRPSGLYIALMATNRPAVPGGAPVTGLFAATSADLLHWSTPKLLQKAGVLFKYDCRDRDVVFYPSLLDPRSPSRNFEDTGDHAYIYLTDIHPEACHIGTNRDLLRIPVTIGVSSAAPAGAAARP